MPALSSSACWCFRSSNAHGVFDSLYEPPLTADIPENPVLDQGARRSTAVTCTGVQTPPRAVATPRALSALAMPRNDVAPLAFICSITGSTLAAKRSAFALLEAMPRRCACASFGPPSFTPCAFAAASTVFHRQLFHTRSPGESAGLANRGFQPIPTKVEGSPTSEPDSRS